MRSTILLGAVVAVCASLHASPARSQAVVSNEAASATQDPTVLVDPAARVRSLTTQMQRAKDRLDSANARFKAGIASVDELRSAQADVGRLELALDDAKKAEQRQAQLARLLQSVDVELKNASLEQAAQSLSKAGSLPVHVDPAEAKDAHITLSARRAQLRAVLEALARNLGLRIDPSSDGGVELHLWPEVVVNGQKQIYADPSPWSAGWGASLSSLAYPSQNNVTGNGLVPSGSAIRRESPQNPVADRTQNSVATNPNNSVAAQQANNSLTLNSGQFRIAPSGLLQGVSIAAVGDAVIVAEPGRGPHGEPGAWLTVYVLAGMDLVRRSATFHPTRALLVTPTDAQPNQQIPPKGYPLTGGNKR